MNVVIVEDEKLIANDLKKQLGICCPDIEILATLHSLKDAIAWFETHPVPDLAFMDIQLSDGTSFEIFEKTGLQCPVIFTTAYNEYALRAFKVNSIDYLLKPIDEDELKNAVEKYRKLHQANTQNPQLTQQLENLVQQLYKPQYKERFTVHYKNTLMPLEAANIALFMRDELIYAYTFNSERYIVNHYESLEEIEKQLQPEKFFRANRQAIVNINAVENYRSDYTGKLHVNLKHHPDLQIDISREKAPLFKKWLE